MGMFIHFFSSLIMKKFSKRVEKTKVTRKDEHFLRKKKSIMVSTSNTNNYCPDGETEKYEIVYFYSYAPIT